MRSSFNIKKKALLDAAKLIYKHKDKDYFGCCTALCYADDAPPVVVDQLTDIFQKYFKPEEHPRLIFWMQLPGESMNRTKQIRVIALLFIAEMLKTGDL